MELTREKILAMPAGPEMDALVAELVMGCAPEGRAVVSGDKKYLLSRFVAEGSQLWKERRPYPVWTYASDDDPRADGWQEWQPSTDIAAAWAVVEKSGVLRSFVLWEYHDSPNGMPWQIQDHAECARAEAETAPLAICRAALLAKL